MLEDQNSESPPRPGLVLVTVAPGRSISCGNASNDFNDTRGPGETLWVEPEEATRLRALGAALDPSGLTPAVTDFGPPADIDHSTGGGF